MSFNLSFLCVCVCGGGGGGGGGGGVFKTFWKKNFLKIMLWFPKQSKEVFENEIFAFLGFQNNMKTFFCDRLFEPFVSKMT